MREEPLYYRLEGYRSDGRQPLALAIGVFDGVHRGHRALLHEACSIAAGDKALRPAALTFDPHPAALFAPDAAPLLLGTLEERAALLRAAGAETVVVAPFDADFAKLTPDAFVQSILLAKLNAGAAIVGEDFQYGRGRVGDADALTRAGQEFGFLTGIVPPVTIDGVPARSTVVRQFLASGAVEAAARLLGRDYTLTGTVVGGKQLGRTIGFPTANLQHAPDVQVPMAGVYAGRVTLVGVDGAGDETFNAAISVGSNPTVAPDGVTLPRTVEAFLLDGFRRDIYGSHIAVSFVARLRGMEKYDSLDTLVAQMHCDVENAKRRLA